MAYDFDWLPPGKADKDKAADHPAADAMPGAESGAEAGTEASVPGGGAEQAAQAVQAAPAPPHATPPPDPNLDEVDDEIRPMVGMVTAMMEAADPSAVAATRLYDADSVDDADRVALEPPSEIAAALADEVSDVAEVASVMQADASLVLSRVEILSRAIERFPDAPVNYVLRGEAHLDEGHADSADMATQDFLRALDLSASRETNWEFVNRGILDRARQGLRRCGYNLAD